MSENVLSMSEAPTPLETADLRYLDPRKLRFFRHGATLRLTVEEESSYLKVTVVRTFPLSHPQRFLSVRAGENKEGGVLVDGAELDEENRRLVADELERRYVVPVIRRAIRLKEPVATL